MILLGPRYRELLRDIFADKVLADEGLAPENLILFGFSQGTMMSLHVAPRREAAVAGVVGFASHPDVLARAGARDCDMLIAATSMDEVNMVACQVAHSVFEVPVKIARVRSEGGGGSSKSLAPGITLSRTSTSQPGRLGSLSSARTRTRTEASRGMPAIE